MKGNMVRESGLLELKDTETAHGPKTLNGSMADKGTLILRTKKNTDRSDS